MSENNKNSNFWSKLKNTKVNRAAVVTAFVLVLALAVIVSITVTINRRKKDPLPEDTTKKVTTTTATHSQESGTTAPPQTTTKKQEVNVVEKLPTFSLPVSGILNKKHDVTTQVYSKTLNDWRVHVGIDITTEENAPVYAAADGTVAKIWEDTLMGYSVAIKHSGDCYTIYKNLAKTLPDGIAEGVSVRAGQLIANVGDSAMIEIADEPHLHFEMTIADLSVNPLDHFDENALEALNVDSSYGD